AVLLADLAPGQRVARDGPHLSPFRGMRMVDQTLQVQVTDDTWYELQAIDGMDIAKLLKGAKELEPRDWWKRLCEDLPALLDAMGQNRAEKVARKLRDPQNGKNVELKDVAMTGETRERAAAGGRAGGPPVVLVARAAAAERVARNGPQVSPFRGMRLVE